MKQLLIVSHAPSPNTRRLRDALVAGAESGGEGQVDVRAVAPLEADADDVIGVDGVILSTPENLAYMSGALKDFFDRSYNPCLERTQGMPYALQVRAGTDGTGTCQAVERIVTGLRWRPIAEPLICRGEFREAFVGQCRELGAARAAGLAAGVL